MLTLILLLLYLLGFSPGHAMKARYLILATPLFFAWVAQLVDRQRSGTKQQALLVSILLIHQTVYATAATLQEIEEQANRELPSIVGSGAPLVIDTVHRGALPGILWHAPASTVVLAAKASTLSEGLPTLSLQKESLV